MSPPTPEPALDEAVAHHTAGRLADAEFGYRHVLSLAPAHPDALHLLGVLLHQTGRSAEAEPLVCRAIQVDANQSSFHTHLGLILATLGRLNEAIECHRSAVALDPRSADAHNNLGVALAAAGRPGEAIDSDRRAVALRPTDVTTLDNLARALHADDRFAESAAVYRQAITIDPSSAALHAELGHVLRAAGALDAAIEAHRRATELAPTSAAALDNLGGALRRAGRADEAMAALGRALALEPDRPQTWNHIGTTHCDAGRWADAIAAFERALARSPDFGDAVNNLGTALEEIGRRDEALDCYRRAVALSPGSPSPPWNLALLQLLLGDYPAGWPGYELRWRQPLQRRVHRKFPQPMWDGSDLAGRTLLLHAEQGFGDAIQFARYAPLAAARGGPVVVECHPPLARLFGTLDGVESVVARDVEPLPGFDVHCPLMSLPRVFGTTLETVPAKVPYLHADPAEAARWRDRLDANGPELRVGLVWAGDGKHQKDRDRSLHRWMLDPLRGVPGMRFYSLQLGSPAGQAGGPAMVDWTTELHDFAATAALVSQLDLVVTADTAVAHLSAALGRPTWVLVPFAPDWRWLLDRDDSPWYPTVRLFRQPAIGDWAEPVRRVAEALRALAANPHPFRDGFTTPIVR
jgi:Flp pilus assembly protein TadD